MLTCRVQAAACLILCVLAVVNSSMGVEYPGDIGQSLPKPSAVNERLVRSIPAKFIITGFDLMMQINNRFVT